MTKLRKPYQLKRSPNVPSLDTGQLFSRKTECQSFNTDQDYYIPY